jgi:hypothetical protein
MTDRPGSTKTHRVQDSREGRAPDRPTDTHSNDLDLRPSLAKLSHVAEALDLPVEDVRSMAYNGAIHTVQASARKMHYVPLAELERLEAEGFKIHWDVLIRKARRLD